MAKPRLRISTGLTVNKIMDMPISKLQDYTVSQQREIISRLGSAANKRLSKLQSKGIENSATMRMEMSGGKVSVRGKDTDELIKEFIRARDFMKNKFSSTREWNKVISNIANKSDDETLSGYSKDTIGKAFSYYDIMREIDNTIESKINKYTLQTHIAEAIESGKKREDIIRESFAYINEQMRENMQDYNENTTRFSNSIEYDIPERARSKRKR